MNANTANTATALCVAPEDLNELVRGQEQMFVQRISPIVKESSVLLDFAHIDRVDAAGIAALIALYATAQSAGHAFQITGARPHVAEVLTLVGLDRILLSRDAAPATSSQPSLARSAA